MRQPSSKPFRQAACLTFLTFGVLAVACKSPTDGSGLKDDSPITDVASTGNVYTGPSGGLSPAENGQLWSKYCTGSVDDVGVPVVPNYADEDVARVARILSTVKPTSFRLYYDMLKMHVTPLPAGIPGLNKSAHEFLTYLCGEFRDRAPMIKAKINWIYNTDPNNGDVGPRLQYLSKSGGGVDKSCAARNDPLMGDVPDADLPPVGTFDRAKSPWAQMCIEDYQPYILISRQIFDYREQTLRSAAVAQLDTPDGLAPTGAQAIGTRVSIDRHVPGFTACETKYIFADYVKKGKKFVPAGQTSSVAYKSYMDGYQAFKTDCTEDDLGWYYDFRGDSNYKPNSPEGNAMIWMGKVAAAQCETRVKAKLGMAMTDADCRHYYEQPFRSRFLAARAGLAAWLLHSQELSNAFKNVSSSYYTIVNHAHDNQNDVFSANGPFLFRTNDVFSGGKLLTPGQPGQYLPGFESHWGDKDFGLVGLSGLQGEAAKQFLYERMQQAVDRHTNWYKSSYDSAPGLLLTNPARRTIDQAFSPFVASSYEMSASNQFSQCGITIPCGNASPEFSQHKQWMFIFKVRKENWFRPEDIAAGNVNPDFDHIWIDETAFGDEGLANSERAWDRMGTPMEDELAEILYLWRIPAE